MKIMAQENDPVMPEVMSLLEVEPAGSPAAAPGQDIPARAPCNSGFYRQMQGSNRRESHTRTSEAVRRQRSHEALQKVGDLSWCQDD